MEEKKEKIEGYYLNEAKKLTNLLYNNDFLNKELSRQSIDWLENFIGFILESQAKTAKTIADFSHKWESKKDVKNY